MPFRFTTAGESHGPGLTAVIEGLPAGLELTPEDIDADLARRQLGHGRGGRMKIEKDRAEVTSGVRHGRTLGEPDRAADGQPRLRQLGGADEPVAGRGRRGGGAPAAARATPTSRASRSSASPTCATCSSAPARARPPRAWRSGALAKVYLRAFGVEIRSHVTRIGSVTAPERATPGAGGLRGRRRVARALPGRGRLRGDGGGDRLPPGRPTSRSAACTRWWPSAWCRASARTCPGTTAWTAASRWRSCRSRR